VRAAEIGFPDRKGFLVEALGLAVAGLIGVEHGQLVDALGKPEIVFPEGLGARHGRLELLFGLGEAAAFIGRPARREGALPVPIQGEGIGDPKSQARDSKPHHDPQQALQDPHLGPIPQN
jgi:hypothetical protein